MKISELHVTGFRSLKDVVWKPGDLNVVIGPNASGKSNLLAALEMLSESAQGHLADYIQSVGGARLLIWNDQSKQIVVKSVWMTSRTRHSWTRANYQLAVAPIPISDFIITEETLQVVRRYGTDQDWKPVILRNSMTDRLYDDDLVEHDLPRKSILPQETILSSIGGIFSPSYVPISLIDAFKRLSVYQSLDASKRSKVRQAVVAQFTEQLDTDTENLVGVLHTLYTRNGEFEEAINDGMKAAFEDFERLKFPPASEQRIQLELKWKSLQKAQSAMYLSDGTLKFLSLLAILANPEPPPLVAIDEPETGLHPRMFPIIAEFAAAASTKTQVVFTTHSPQFLDAFRDQTPTVTVAQWEDGQTRLETLDGGELKHWLDNYSLGSLFKSGELEAMA